jgi:3',5'-cyclic AMP phosphodiesterase CpdA
VTDVSLVHLSDLHFGGLADLPQAEALEAFVPTLPAQAIVVSGDLSQRARHGEFQRAKVFVQRMQEHAPTLVIPGNHDIEWWKSPLGIRGRRVKYAKYLRYFRELTPVLEIPGAADAARVLVIHHNILPGAISRRMGLANWRSAQRRLLATGADVVLCGHDHQEGAGQVDGGVTVSTSGTPSLRSRGGRPSMFNLVQIESSVVHVQHYRWEAADNRFVSSDRFSFARRVTPEPVVSSAGGV